MTIDEIRKELRRPLPKAYLGSKEKGNNDIEFIPWFRATYILDDVTNGQWDYEIVKKDTIGDNFFTITVRVTIYADDETRYKEGTGVEKLSVGTDDWGDFQSKAESMAFRRALARFGLGLYLREKDNGLINSKGELKPVYLNENRVNNLIKHAEDQGVEDIESIIKEELGFDIDQVPVQYSADIVDLIEENK